MSSCRATNGELDVSPSQLTDALLERERKEVKARWVATLWLADRFGDAGRQFLDEVRR